MQEKIQMIKTENQMYADIIGFVKNFLENFQLSGKWQVLQLKQPVKLTELSPTIWVTITFKSRRGWQYETNKVVNEVYTHSEKFKQEINVQFSATSARKPKDTLTTQNSSDVLEALKTYFLSPQGLKSIRAAGYEIYQPNQIDLSDFFNDSDNFEFMPMFTLVFITEQSLDNKQEEITKITFKDIKGV